MCKLTGAAPVGAQFVPTVSERAHVRQPRQVGGPHPLPPPACGPARRCPEEHGKRAVLREFRVQFLLSLLLLVVVVARRAIPPVISYERRSFISAYGSYVRAGVPVPPTDNRNLGRACPMAPLQDRRGGGPAAPTPPPPQVSAAGGRVWGRGGNGADDYCIYGITV